MVGVSVHGLLGVDTELQRSAFAVQQQQQHQRMIDYGRGDCPHQGPVTAPSQRT